MEPPEHEATLYCIEPRRRNWELCVGRQIISTLLMGSITDSTNKIIFVCDRLSNSTKALLVLAKTPSIHLVARGQVNILQGKIQLRNSSKNVKTLGRARWNRRVDREANIGSKTLVSQNAWRHRLPPSASLV